MGDRQGNKQDGQGVGHMFAIQRMDRWHDALPCHHPGLGFDRSAAAHGALERQISGSMRDGTELPDHG